MEWIKRLSCLFWHQTICHMGYHRENRFWICSECLTKLSPIIGDKINDVYVKEIK